MRFVAESLFAAFFPSDCRLCSRPLSPISRLPVCAYCLASIAPLGSSVCDICGDVLSSNPLAAESRSCLRCQEERPRFDRAIAYGAYDGVLRDLIHLLKYDRMLSAARPLGEALANAIRAHLSSDKDEIVIVPVPLHRSRLRQRGFNQAERLARAAMRAIPGLRAVLADGVLKRTRATGSQTGFTREQRRRNLRGAFAVLDAAKIRGRSVLLVDDVLTTGATAEECARVLRKSGARAVWVATVARAVSYSDSPRPDLALTETGAASG